MIDNLAIKPPWQSSKLDELQKLSTGDIHVWCLSLRLDSEQEQQTLNWISPHQRNKYNRRQSPELKKAYLAGRYYLLTLLAHYANSHPDQIQLSYSDLNKPYMKGSASDIHFNLSDTIDQNGPTAMLAFSRSGEVGVDIESLSRRSNFKAIVERRFTKAEQQLVMDADNNINPALFLCIWTRKEASGKATGQGINFKMNQRQLVSTSQQTDNGSELDYFDENQRPWHLTQLRLNEQHVGCVVYAGHTTANVRYFNKLY